MKKEFNFKRNNLDKATSPYLLQHKSDPIYWQEWNLETVAYARENKKLLFVSVGYATCHWCHVMAHDTFSSTEIATVLNTDFVSIKVDREERPDIDQYLMAFALETQDISGWPLNVFLTPDLKPFGAVGYAAPLPRYGMPAFQDILERVKDFYSDYKEQIEQYTVSPPQLKNCAEDKLISSMYEQFDTAFGGFGDQQKFPPHTTLLFLLHYYEKTQLPEAHEMIERTVESIANYGLHDHLQGGFFRYCVDQAWQIPHFEKMLYDQALLLWVYSVAFKVFGHMAYKQVAEKLLTALEQTFKNKEQLYSAGHDADTHGVEGATYTWTYKELEDALSPGELREFLSVYKISKEGNFEEKNHLVKWSNKFVDVIEKKLLDIRKARPQPAVDTTVITSWNALLGIAYVMAARYLPDKKLYLKAQTIFSTLIEKHTQGDTIYHSSVNGVKSNHAFLEDSASMLLLATYLYEDTQDALYKNFVEQHVTQLNHFCKNGVWQESLAADFATIPASFHDQPTPSSISLAEYALARIRLLFKDRTLTIKTGCEFDKILYGTPLIHDFYNIPVFQEAGNFFIVSTPEKLRWQNVPLNLVQLFSESPQVCYQRSCTQYKTIEALVKKLHKL